MRRALLGVLFILALVAIAVPIAQGTSTAKDPRVAGLVKKVTALQKQVAALTTRSNCIGVQGAVLRGGENAGYVYTPDGGTTVELRSAVDAPVQGEAPQILMAVVNPACVTASKLYRSTGRLSSRSARYRSPR